MREKSTEIDWKWGKSWLKSTKTDWKRPWRFRPEGGAKQHLNDFRVFFFGKQRPLNIHQKSPPSFNAKIPGKQNTSQTSSEQIKSEKAAQRVSFGAGYPADIHADIPVDVRGQKLRWSPRNLGKISISVRTSMTRRRGRPWPSGVQKNFGQKNFGLNFHSLTVTGPNIMKASKTPPWKSVRRYSSDSDDF